MFKTVNGFRSLLPAGALLAALTISPLHAELSPSALDLRLTAIATDAQALEAQAWEMQEALRVRSPDYAAVRDMLAEVTAKIDLLDESVADLREQSPAWASSSSEYAAMAEKAQLLQIFAKNKGELLNSPSAAKSRKILAAKAKGIALRASMLHDFAATYGD